MEREVGKEGVLLCGNPKTAIAGIGVDAGVVTEVVRLRGVGDAVGLLQGAGLFLVGLCFVGYAFQIGIPVLIRQMQEPVGDEVTDDARYGRPILVGKNDDSDAVAGEEAGAGGEAVDIPAVFDAVVTAIGGKHPAKAIAGEEDVGGFFGRQAAAHDHLRGDRFGGMISRDDLLPLIF